MFRFLVLAMFVALTSAFMAPVMPSKLKQSKITIGGGPGSGDHGDHGRSKFGGEATRDPEPTVYDPNDPKGKQAIHKAESFAEYLAKRDAGGAAAAAPAAAAAAPAVPPLAFLSGTASGASTARRRSSSRGTRSRPAPTPTSTPSSATSTAPSATPTAASRASRAATSRPSAPTSASLRCRRRRCLKLDELAQHPNWGKKGCPGCYSLKWQAKLGAPPLSALTLTALREPQ